MPYAARQDLIDRFGEQEIIQLTDKANPPAGVIDQAVLDSVSADADGVIDSYIASRYTLPLAAAPKILVRYACDITRYFLYGDQPGEAQRRAYDDAIKFLRSVADGTVSLGLDSANQAVAPAAGAVSFNDSRRDFGGEREIG
jgi:phage gp36-like protein